MKKLTIALDIDDVLFPCMAWAMKIANQRYNADIDFENIPADFHTLPPEQEKALIDVLATGEIYDLQKPYDGAQELVAKLHNVGHDVVFLTSPEPDWKVVRTKQILEFFPDTSKNDIILTDRKDLVHTDFLFDDNPRYILNSPAKWAIINDRPWNRHIPEHTRYHDSSCTQIVRAKNYDFVYDLIQHIANL